jgi:hypothetical protein
MDAAIFHALPVMPAYAIILPKISISPLAVIMRKSFLPVFILLISSLPLAAQEANQHFGPVVSAYLMSLSEELRELEYQLTRQEISRRNYDRTKQRLLLTRTVVEKRARQSTEDRVPELQLLPGDELRSLSETAARQAAALRPGTIIDGQWKLAEILQPQSGLRFYVFEKIESAQTQPNENSENDKQVREQSVKPQRNVIETIVIRTSPPAVRRKVVTEPPPPVLPAPRPAPVATAPQVNAQRLRIQKIFLPKYSDKALEAKVTGELLISALFRRDGKVKEVKVLRGLGYGLDERTTEALKQTVFEPAKFQGNPVDLRLELGYLFRDGKVTIQMQTEQLLPPAPQENKR